MTFTNYNEIKKLDDTGRMHRSIEIMSAKGSFVNTPLKTGERLLTYKRCMFSIEKHTALIQK